MKKRTVKCLLCICMYLLFTGCTKTKEKQYAKTVYIGSDEVYPYFYINEEGEFAGVDVDIARAAFEAMGVQPVFTKIDWEKKKVMLQNRSIDCLWGSFSMNGREEEYQWAGPYMHSRQLVVVRKDSDIFTLQDLEGKEIGVQATTKPEEILIHHEEYGLPEVEKLYSFSNVNEIYGAMRKGYLDGICGHESSMRSFIDTNPDAFRSLEESIYSSDLGVAFSKTYDSTFVKSLDKELNSLKQDGTVRKIVEKYGLDAEYALGGKDD